MHIKNFLNKTVDFAIKRIVELLGVIFVGVAILLFLALISYSPEDPNFIFDKNTEIKNLLGIQGSYISDLFFQSLGLVSLLVPFTFFFTGINIFRNKKTLLIIENIFFAILYCITATLFFSVLLSCCRFNKF